MGLTSSKDDPQGKRYLVPELERFAKEGFGFIFAFDADTYTKKPVKQALIKLARQIQKYNVPVYSLPEWDERDGKGVDDFIKNQGIEEFRKQLLSQAYCFDDWYSKYGSDAFTTVDGNKIPKPDIVGVEIAEQYSDRWVYCDELKTWLTYSLETEGIWTLVSKDYLAAEIHGILKARNIKGYGTNAYVENIIGTLKRELFIRKWDEKSSTDWLPFRNGVLELATNKLHDHNPGFKFTWQLPRDYTIIETGWSAIANWLDEATKGNQEYKELLLCFAAAVLRGRNDLQKFLHLIGGGGSGKSTFTTLLTALVGESNTATMNLSELEDKHEIARIFGKRLVVLPDQDKAPKKMSNFKRLTGQDRLSGRRLFENGFEYVFGGLTVVTSNFPIFHTNLGSWLTRRVSMIPFDYQCPNHKKKDLMKEFEGELGAFTSYLLSIPETEIEAVLKGIGDRSLSTTVWESQIRSEGLAAWVNEWVIQDNTDCVPIGSNAHEWKVAEDYDATCSTLYGSYALYCQQTKRSAKSPQNFSAELIELTNRTLGWLTEKARLTIAGKRARVIKGLRLRSPYDKDLTVEEILAQKKGDNPKDNYGTTCGTTPETLLDKERDNWDNPFENFEKNHFNLSHHCDNFSTVTQVEEVEKKNLLNNSASVVEVVPTQTEKRIEAVPEVGTRVVPEVVPPEINWQSYPYNSGDHAVPAYADRAHLENRALKVVRFVEAAKL
ncbi:Phage/plasmid primase, P4 family, C-terminal domain (fragment) [Hyella patelloides LEGE 07179]|uniref:Phage/plasmid primase, P4 family, C-terminal domain n=2 Tax=Hyella TaxID=945733 RepID=A0A563VZZ2_9CYAN